MQSGACCGSNNSTHHTIRLMNQRRPGIPNPKDQNMSPVSTIVNVSGMTCGHCISAVSEELEALDGVENVDVDLNAGGISTVTVTSERELSASEVGEAVAEAGYLVVATNA